MASIWAHPADLVARRSVKWRRYPPDVLPVWVAEMDVELAEPVRAALAEALDRSDTGYPHPNGLFEAFAGFARRRFGWNADPGEMVMVADVAQGAIEMLRILTDPGDGVVVNTPVYPPFFAWVQAAGRRLVSSPLGRDGDGWCIDLDRLEYDFAAGARAYLLCSPHNPTGSVPSPAELTAVAELADRHGVRVIADEVHAPLAYPPAAHTPFASLDLPAARAAVTLVSASKAWNLAGLKCALVVAGPDAMPDVARLSEEVSESTGLFGVLANEAAFSDGDEWLAGVVAALDANRRLLGALLEEQLPEVGYRQPDATYLGWLDLREYDLGGDPAAVLIERGRVALSRGLDFGVEGAGFARFNFATAPELVTEAVRRMAAAV